MPGHFEDIEMGQVVSLGAAVVDLAAMGAFITAFAPGWDIGQGAPDSMVYAIWDRLDRQAAADWPERKRLAVDALRWARNPPPGELLKGRMTVMGKDRVGDTKGVIIAQHDLIDESGRLVFSCLTRSLYACRG
jgi:acyl dehydratase